MSNKTVARNGSVRKVEARKMQEFTHLLTQQEQTALRQLKNELAEIEKVVSVIIFGSVARCEVTMDSDLDVLAVLDRELSYTEETAAYDAFYRINLQYDTNISLVVVDVAIWALPIWQRQRLPGCAARRDGFSSE
ncbi:MAG: nucleotidyltransferase domain-containing protein [Negativicutes bacterium]